MPAPPVEAVAFEVIDANWEEARERLTQLTGSLVDLELGFDSERPPITMFGVLDAPRLRQSPQGNELVLGIEGRHVAIREQDVTAAEAAWGLRRTADDWDLSRGLLHSRLAAISR